MQLIEIEYFKVQKNDVRILRQTNKNPCTKFVFKYKEFNGLQ